MRNNCRDLQNYLISQGPLANAVPNRWDGRPLGLEFLAIWAEMAAPVHPRITLYFTTAPITGMAGHSIGIERNREITAFAIDILVLLIKAGATLLDGLG